MGSKAFAVFALFLTILMIGQATIDCMIGRIMAIIGETGVWCTCIATIFENHKSDDEEEDEENEI